MRQLSKLFLVTLTLALATLATAQTPAPAPKTAQPKTSTKKAELTPPPSAQEIADAKSKGMVWVNLGSGVYHKDGEFFGKTKRGKFMTEADATKAGYRAAKAPAAAKKDTAKPKAETKK